MVGEKLDVSLVNAIAFDPYTHGYYKAAERVGEAFKDGLQLKNKTCTPQGLSGMRGPV